MVARSFAHLPGPKWIFACGALTQLPSEVAALGSRCLLVVGGRHLAASGQLERIRFGLEANGVHCRVLVVEQEPSPEAVDAAVAASRRAAIDVVAAVGGGSVIDTGKAVAAMAQSGKPVEPYLEVAWGHRPYEFEPLPFVAAPTTAGTGSEATANAVLGRTRRDGWKASLRHERLVPTVAVIDPLAMQSCPDAVRDACAFDALTHLLESFVSTKADETTDRLAGDGLEAIGNGIRTTCCGQGDALEGWQDLAYASSLGGITLARAGLGIVHGLAPVLGAQHAIPHGLACATTLAAATRGNIDSLRANPDDRARRSLAKYAAASRRLLSETHADEMDANDALLEQLDRWTRELAVLPLGALGVRPTSLPAIANAAKLKNNPAALGPDQVHDILERSH